MGRYTVGISTQTPLLKFEPAAPAVKAIRAGGQTLQAVEEADGASALPPHRMTPGGVCRMVLPTLRHLDQDGWLAQAQWYSLQPGAPDEVRLDDVPVTLRHLQLPASDVAAYARTKEKLWADIHGLPRPRFDPEDFRFYARYNAFTADALLQHASELDVAHIHDFQLILVGGLMGLAAPTVFQWHVPWDPRRIPPYTRQFLVRAMEDFDTVVVSTSRDLQGLLDAGFHGRARKVSPYIDPADWPDTTTDQRHAVEAHLRLGPDQPMLLLVARMDPMKRQDLAIRAFARVAREHPDAVLVLVGNGSFSGSKKGAGGLGVGKADRWTRELKELTAHLRLEDRVRFTHWIPDELLAPTYARATAVLLPSDIEGFGLTVLEAWRYGRPAIVASGVGAAEAVTHGVNGLVFESGDELALADCVRTVLADPDLREEMGRAGARSLPPYTVEAATPKVRAVLEEAMEGFHRP